MANIDDAHGWNRVHNDAVWRHTKRIFVGSLLVFLVNVTLGFGNVVTPGAIPRWQVITHLHGGTLGWLTLSAIGFTVWQFTGDRDVSATYERRVGWLSWAAVIIGAGYVLSFGVGFSLTGDAFALMPVFGTGMLLVIWATALLALSQLRHQPVVRTVHLLLAGAFTVASLGAIWGVLLGLQHAIGPLPLPDGMPSTGNHAGPMDIYALIVGSALIEWLVERGDVKSWTWPGAVQAGVWTLAGIIGFIPVGDVAGIGIPLGFLLGPLIFLLRMGWRGVLLTPFRADESAWGFFGPIWLVVFVGGVVGAISGTLPQDAEWVGVVIFHAYFVGYITNSLFGILSGRTRDGELLHEWAEPAAMWLVNLGLLAFAATEIAMGSRHGAVLMGAGVLLGVATFGYRLIAESARTPASSPATPR